jgi:hypothetical protein
MLQNQRDEHDAIPPHHALDAFWDFLGDSLRYISSGDSDGEGAAMCLYNATLLNNRI